MLASANPKPSERLRLQSKQDVQFMGRDRAEGQQSTQMSVSASEQIAPSGISLDSVPTRKSAKPHACLSGTWT